MIAYKYKLYRTKQTKHLDAMLREASWAWNHALALHKRYYRMYGGYIDVTRMQKKWVQWFGKSSRHHSQTVQEVLQRLDKSYQRFFQHIQARPPKFKKADDFKSFVFKQGGYSLNGNVLTINKIKKRYKFSLSRPYVGVGAIKNVAVKRTPLGEYFMYLFIEAKPEPVGKTHHGASVGIDFGLKTYMTLSNGERIQSPRYLKQALGAKRTADRWLSRKQEGSNHRRAARRAKNRVEEMITNRRDNCQWQQAHDLCRRFDTICIEDLQLTGMTSLWGRKMADLAHGKFVRKLEYLAVKYGVKVQKVDRFFLSSQLCHVCGHRYFGLRLEEREWTCPSCGTHHDRDLNAAINIKNIGLGLNEALPSERGKVKPAKQPPVDDRCPVQPKKQRCAEAGKAKVHRDPKPRSL